MGNAVGILPWALGEAHYVEQSQALPGARPQRQRLPRRLGGMGAGGSVLGEEEPLAGLPVCLLTSQ